METRTYFASSVPAALEVARRELGHDALLVSSRPSPPLVRELGRFEVTFAWEPKELLRPAQPSLNLSLNLRNASESDRALDLDEIRLELSALRKAVGDGGPPGVARSGSFGGVSGARVESARIESALIEAGFNPASAHEMATAASRRPGPPVAAVHKEITERIPVAPFVDLQPGESRTLAFIGPPGRGKTTSLVKIALTRGLAMRIPVRIFSAGAHAIGGQEQIARYAAVLGVPHQCYESMESLSLAMNGDAWKGLLLIDTPGISPADELELGEFARFFSRRKEIERHLVLRAEATSADMLHVIDRFAPLAPSRLLFTGVDEAVSRAAMVETLMRSRIAATFAGRGPQIPDDLEELRAETLARAVWASPATPDSDQLLRENPRGQSTRFARAAA